MDFVRYDNKVEYVIIKFDVKGTGKNLRERYAKTNPFHNIYEDGVPIPRTTFTYNLSKKQYKDGQKVMIIPFSNTARLRNDCP